MIIKINTDNKLTVPENFQEKLNSMISEELGRFDDRLSRIEVHLSDENGDKEAPNDKKCLLEARIKGKQPVVVSALANNEVMALKSAILKLKTLLDTQFGKMNEHATPIA
jgi:hexokinase